VERAEAGIETRALSLSRALLALAVSTVIAVGTGVLRPMPARAAEPGVNVSNPSAAQLADIRELGTHWVRMFVSWPMLEPAPGGISRSALGSFEQTLSGLPAGTKVILDVFGSPRWETGSSDEHAPPANPNDYAAFVAGLAQHLRGRVSAYEIWNEEDEDRGWSGGPNPAAYAQLLKATYPAVKAADPRATVVLGGMTGNDYPFLEGVYAAGGRGSFDAVGVHTDTACNVLSPYDFLRGPDNRMIPDSFLAYREVHATMLANGDDKPIWMTETSWRTTTAVCSEGAWAGQKPEGVSPELQATYLSQAYHCLAHDPYVQVALWFPLQDGPSMLNGLVRSGGTHKPSFAAMRSYVQHGDQLHESCGVFTGPKIKVLSPARKTRYSGPLPIHVSARSSIGVFRITLRIDGKLIRNFGGHTYPTTLSGVLKWQGAKHIPLGRHTLGIQAFDRQRNVSETSVAIVHVARHAKKRHRRHR
jgi:hypothetical protein